MTLLEELEKEREFYIKKQFSRNPYYVLLRFFGAYWSCFIREIERWIKFHKEKQEKKR